MVTVNSPFERVDVRHLRHVGRRDLGRRGRSWSFRPPDRKNSVSAGSKLASPLDKMRDLIGQAGRPARVLDIDARAALGKVDRFPARVRVVGQGQVAADQLGEVRRGGMPVGQDKARPGVGEAVPEDIGLVIERRGRRCLRRHTRLKHTDADRSELDYNHHRLQSPGHA
jgi:hypothetical protein